MRGLACNGSGYLAELAMGGDFVCVFVFMFVFVFIFVFAPEKQ